MIFRLQPLRFSFAALETIHFPEGKSANILRGAFGVILRRLACVPQCTGVAGCELRLSSPYARIFEPFAIAPGPSGLADWPRPFVFRAMHLDGRRFSAGDRFHFDLNLFDVKVSVVDFLIRTFVELAHEGLGPSRRKVELIEVARVTESRECGAVLYATGRREVSRDQAAAPLEFDLSSGSEAISRVRVKFIAPTELKSGPHRISQPDFGILATRARDRISTLRELYSDGPLTIDFRAFGERSALVRMTRCDIRQVDVVRRSSRTGQSHAIGGFIGEAEYEGQLTEFVPYLTLASYTGIGRQTAWGKGEITVLDLP